MPRNVTKTITKPKIKLSKDNINILNKKKIAPNSCTVNKLGDNVVHIHFDSHQFYK